MNNRKDENMTNKFIDKVKGELLDIYGISESKAFDLIMKSTFYDLINEDLEYVVYYSPDYWAEDIMRKVDLKFE